MQQGKMKLNGCGSKCFDSKAQNIKEMSMSVSQTFK